MDWKEQLQTLLDKEPQTLDVRLICIRDKEKWFLKRLRAIVFHAEPTIPEQICYSSYLFLRGKMNSSDFFQLISDLTSRSSLSPEELAKLTDEEKLKKFTFKGWEIVCEFVNIYLRGHTRGNSRWGLGEYTLPSWNFDGNLQPDIQDSQEPLIAEEEHYFPKPIDGLQGEPQVIYLALTYGDIWLDRREINLLHRQFGIPRDVNIIVKDDPVITPTIQEEVASMIATQGENMTLEFKSRLDEGEGIEKNRLLQSVVAFANTKGGTILLGVAKDGQVLGLQPNDTKDTVVRKIDGNVSPVPYFEVIPQEQEGKQILVIRVRESTLKPCALMVNTNKPLYYVRMDGSNKLAKPEDMRLMSREQG